MVCEVIGYFGAAQQGFWLSPVLLPQWLPCLHPTNAWKHRLTKKSHSNQPFFCEKSSLFWVVKTQSRCNTTLSPGEQCHCKSGQAAQGLCWSQRGAAQCRPPWQWWLPWSPELAAGRKLLERRQRGRERWGLQSVIKVRRKRGYLSNGTRLAGTSGDHPVQAPCSEQGQPDAQSQILHL